MKKSILFLILLQSLHTFAQAPQKMTYQSVVRNSANVLVANQNVGVRISILEGSQSGTAVYSETHSVTTNANGLFTLEAGGGTPTEGVFANIAWSNGAHYIKSEIDPNGGTNYTLTSTKELLSVPYALNGITTSQADAITTQAAAIASMQAQIAAQAATIAAMQVSTSSPDTYLSVNSIPIPAVKRSCSTNGGPLENIIASSGSWWTTPSAIGWFNCYTSPNGIWWGGCTPSFSTIQPSMCGLQISTPVQSQIIHNYINFNSNKVQFNIKSIGQCFDTNITFKFYDSNNNLIPSFAEYKRGITNGSAYSYGGITYLPISTTYLSSNNTQTYTVLMWEFGQAFYEHSLTFFVAQNAVRMEIVFDALAANTFSQSCSQYLYNNRTPADGLRNNGSYYLGDIDYTLLKWQ